MNLIYKLATWGDQNRTELNCISVPKCMYLTDNINTRGVHSTIMHGEGSLAFLFLKMNVI